MTLLLLVPISIGVNIIVARTLGPSDKGVFSFMLLMGDSLVPVLFLGFGVGGVYLISAEKFEAKNVILVSTLIGFLKGGLITLLLWVLWVNDWLGRTAQEIEARHMIPIMLSLPLSGFISIAKQIFKGSSKFKLLNIFSLADGLFNAGFLIIFVLFTGWGLDGAVFAVILQKILTTAVVLYLLIRSYKPRLTIDIPFVIESYRYGNKAWIGNIATRANDRFDQLILGLFANSTLLGWYSVAFSMVRFLGFFPQAIDPVFFNLAAKQNDPEKSAQLLAQVHRALLILVGILAIILGLTGYWLISWLYGEEFGPAYIPFLIMLPGMFIYSASRRLINKYLGANGMPGKMSIVQASGAIVGLVLYLILIPIFDINGAAWGSTIAYLVSSAVALYFFYQVVPKGKVNLFRVGISDIKWIMSRLPGALNIVQRLRGKKVKKQKEENE